MSTVTSNPTMQDPFEVKHPPKYTYEGVFGGLFILTALEFAVSELMHLDTLPFVFGAFLLVVMAVVKAVLVGGFFMHIFYEKKPLVILFITFLFPLMIGVPIALSPLFSLTS